MPRKNPDVEETDDKDLEVGKPKEWAAGIPGVSTPCSQPSNIWA
jgi:hypothetical protein